MTTKSSQKPRQVPCPTCGKPALFAPENRWRPFCSERCKLIDIGAWASDQYRVEGQDLPLSDEAPDKGS